MIIHYNADNTVTIPVDYFDDLVQRNNILETLKAGGVENWEGYADTMSFWKGAQ